MLRLFLLVAFSAMLAIGSVANGQDGLQCTVVELQPGYPGYRGFVTGLRGAGEGACLEDLQRDNPAFDAAAEDAANAAAAARLGISGDASTWLWENWLAIEAERGLTPTCYRAAYSVMPSNEPFQRVVVDFDDPRMVAGQPGTTNWIDAAAYDVGVTNATMMREFLVDDSIFRAHAFAWSGRIEPNAPELLEAGRTFVADMSGVNGGGGSPLTYTLLMKQGGYVPVPANACPADQWFLAQVTLLTMFQAMPSAAGYYESLEIQYEHWSNDMLYTDEIQSFRDYLAENWDMASSIS